MSHRSVRGPDLKPSQATLVRKVLQAGINAEDILFSKASRSLHSSVLEFGDSYSGFRGNRICDTLRKKHTSISCIRWTCPPKFILNGDWLLAAGDQSEERRVQEQRQTGVTEVIYPHPSAIPSSPSISSDVEEGHRDDGHDPPIIPITPIEDDETDSSHKVEPPPSVKENVSVEVLDQGVPTSHLLPHASPRDAPVAAPKPCNRGTDPLAALTGLEADIGAAASVAFTALVKSNEQGSLIDTDLLIKILSDPKMIELLRDARPFSSEKVTVPHEVKQESSLMIQPALDRRSALNINNLLSPPSRDPGKEGSTQLPTRTQLTSEILAMLMSNTAIPSVPPPCSVSDTMLQKQVCRNEDTLLKQSQTVSNLMEFISSAMLAPKSERASSQKLENLVHDSFPVSKLLAPSVAMSTRAPNIPFQEDPRNLFPTPTRPQPSCLSMAASPGSSAYKSSLSGKTTQSILDANYYKSLVRQHGVERPESKDQNSSRKTRTNGIDQPDMVDQNPQLNSQEASASAHNNPKPMPMPTSTPILDKGKQKLNQGDYNQKLAFNKEAALKAKNNFLMGFVFGDPLDFKKVRGRLLREWRLIKGEAQLNERGHGWFEISFSKPRDLKRVWERRPYHVADRILLLRPWKHDFNTTTEDTTLLDIWIRILHLPPVLACPKEVQLILEHNKVGTFVRLDTANGESFTRICANIDITQGILREVTLSEPGKKDYPLPIWFEDFPKGCGNCGEEDHLFGDCPLRIPKTNPINQPTTQPVFPTKKNPKAKYQASNSKPIPPHGIKPLGFTNQAMSSCSSLKREGVDIASSKLKRNKKANKNLN